MNNHTGLAYQLHDVTKSYGGREVCRASSLEIPWGTILCIMGPNGSGKSTLLRLLNFLEPATSGTITFAGYAWSDGAWPPLELRRMVTMVFQRPLLISGSVEENVALGLRLRREREVKERVRAVLDTLDLTRLARANVGTLSGGEAQRVALARALVIQPQVLLLDEPTANLDPQNVAVIESVIAESNRLHGTTIVLVTHNTFQARRLAHQVAFLLDGRLVEVSSASQMFASPQDPRTAAFIRGEMVY